MLIRVEYIDEFLLRFSFCFVRYNSLKYFRYCSHSCVLAAQSDNVIIGASPASTWHHNCEMRMLAIHENRVAIAFRQASDVVSHFEVRDAVLLMTRCVGY